MSRRSSRASSIAAAAKISGAVDDDDDGNDNPLPSETESSSGKSDVLKGTEKSNSIDGATNKKAAKKKKASPKKKKAVSTKKSEAKSESGDESDSSEPATKKAAKKKSSPKKKKATTTKKGKAKSESDDESVSSEPKAKKKKAAPKKRKSKSATDEDESSTTTAKKQKKSPKKKGKAAELQRWTERTPLIRHWDPEKAMESSGSYTFTVISWNVAGLRSFVKKQPDALMNLANKYQADVICLQEHKLQDIHLDDKKLKLREYFEEKLGDFDGHWSYSLGKKGYSGTAMFIRKRAGGGKETEDGKKGDEGSKKGKKQATLGAFFGSAKTEDGGKEGGGTSTGDVPISHLAPINVDTELGLPAHDGEGRTVTAEFPLFYLTNVYVPNSGAKLDRLGYRTEQWDTDFLAKMQQLEKDGDKPVIWLGDLNVAHNEKDTWNEGAKHLAKSAGTTAEERASFDRQLGEGYVDAFRQLHPEGRGHYSYWSQRAGNREPNKGLRLDYFICSKELMEDGDGNKVRVRDSYIVPEVLGSDHCPIVLEIEIKK